jgi:hypothetical protein
MKSIFISIAVSDPWDVGVATNWRPIQGSLFQTGADEQVNKVLLKFSEPINYHGTVYHYAVVVPRHKESQILDVFAGMIVPCIITGISDAQANSDNSLDISKWRGGLAFEGDVKTKPMQ